MKFSRPEYRRGSPIPFPADLPEPGIELRSPELQQILSKKIKFIFPILAILIAKVLMHTHIHTHKTNQNAPPNAALWCKM